MYGLAIFDIQTHKEIYAICTLDKSDPLNEIPFSNMTRGEKLRRTFSVRQSRTSKRGGNLDYEAMFQNMLVIHI